MEKYSLINSTIEHDLMSESSNGPSNGIELLESFHEPKRDLTTLQESTSCLIDEAFLVERQEIKVRH